MVGYRLFVFACTGVAAAVAYLSCPALAAGKNDTGKMVAAAWAIDPLTAFLERELQRNFLELRQAEETGPYFAAYRLNDTVSLRFSANRGGVIDERASRSRYVDVELRVGDSAVDNTHSLREYFGSDSWNGYRNLRLPLEDDSLSLSRNLRIASDFAFRAARDRYAKLIANLETRPPEADTGLDLAGAHVIREAKPPVQPFWVLLDSVATFEGIKDGLREASRAFAAGSHVLMSEARLDAQAVTKRFATTEGTVLLQRENIGRVSLYVEGKADDGEILWLTHDWHFRAPWPHIPADSLKAAASLLVKRLDTLRRAPVMETWSGPVILENLAAAVFVHEVLGHRVEGHRLKAVEEGQTFVSKIGHRVAPKFVNIYDDPLLEQWGGVILNGHYRFDDEGVAARRVDIIRKGVFTDFLFGRATLSPKGMSNGHGRGILGVQATSRMGNTVLEAGKGKTRAQLRRMLLNRVKRTGKSYGLIVHQLSGGFTYTQRDLPQSFKLEPLYVTRVYADGRPDEMVRGVDVAGMPLSSLGSILAVGDDPAVFNGHCGAESGWLPVSAISSSLLLESLEFETKARDQNRPPILTPPGSVSR